jgi:hypothetical protein
MEYNLCRKTNKCMSEKLKKFTFFSCGSKNFQHCTALLSQKKKARLERQAVNY